MDSERPAPALAEALADLDVRWEILDTGVTVKLYPSCAATHPPLDICSVSRVATASRPTMWKPSRSRWIRLTPRLLIYPRPSSELEAKFSMPFARPRRSFFGHPTIDTSDVQRIRDPASRR